MKQEKRGLSPYDDTRYLFVDLHDGRPNQHTHAYGHRDLAAEEHLVADHPEPGAELIIRYRNKRFTRKHALVTTRLKRAGVMDMEEELFDGDADGELHGDQLLVSERVAAALPVGAIQMGEIIKQIIARYNFEKPVSPPARMSVPPTQQRAVPSGLNAHLPQLRRRVNSFDEKKPERPVWPLRRPHLEFDDGNYVQAENAEPVPPRRRKKARRSANPFIDAETGVDGDASGDDVSDHENDDLDGFIVADDVEY